MRNQIYLSWVMLSVLVQLGSSLSVALFHHGLLVKFVIFFVLEATAKSKANSSALDPFLSVKVFYFKVEFSDYQRNLKICGEKRSLMFLYPELPF